MSSQTDTFKIRWGKLALALIGVLAVLATPVTFVVALVSPLSLWTPLLCLALVVISFAGLRASAVKDRQAKAWQRAAATVPQRVAAQPEAAQAKDTKVAQPADKNASDQKVAAQKTGAQKTAAQVAAAKQAAEKQAAAEKAAAAAKDRPFDMQAQDKAPAEVAAPQQDVTVTATQAEPAAQATPASSGTAVAQTAPVQTPTPDTSWAPRELPVPGYVGAARAERSAPAPLEQAAEKRATEVTSIRQAEADRVAEERAERLNLDAVLQRRRA
ncbi:hypothetical protein [Galactobacter caseinivorans]|uniref:Uncharacterized protein n=1 Tax=Galactobacter caseinivorans TaxID=2676123 RepID=A0A496PM41_9MICC|nr:hypothetical protein [Galactobacter caseinivorans]RKW71524.1 hypothetical protein DWQ67_01370 [Galactobacter caseinivorans]